MKPLKTGSSASRRGRTIAIAGASAVALLAPFVTTTVAGAATNNSLGVSVTAADGESAFPAQTLWDATPATDGSIALTNQARQAIEENTAGNVFNVEVRATGTDLGNVTATTDSIEISSNIITGGSLELAGTGTPGDSRTLSNSAVLVENADATTGANLAGAAKVFAGDFDLAVDTATDSGWLGKINFTVSIVERTSGGALVATLGSTSFSTTVAKPVDPVLNEDTAGSNAIAATFPLQAAHSVDVVKSFGVLPQTPTITLTSGATLVSDLNGVTTFKDGEGNVFAFDASTGKISAVAGAVKKFPATPAVVEIEIPTPDAGGTTYTDVTLNVGFKDDASITPSLKADVYWAVGDEIVEGYNDGTFRPQAPVTRQAFAAFLYRAQNPGAVAPAACTAFAPSGFSDVPNDHPFCGEIRELAKSGVTTGYTDGGFHPAEPITRRAISAMLYRVDQIAKGFNSSSPSWSASAPSTAVFNDVATTDTFAGEINWMYTSGVANGYDDGGFHPGASSSRQATVTFLHRMFP